MAAPEGLQNARGFVCFLANAGIYVRFGRRSVLIDGLQRGPSRFSDMTDEQIRSVINGTGMFSNIDCLLVTHNHPDHYNPVLTRRMLRNHPETVVLGPVEQQGRHVGVLDQMEGYAVMPGMDIHFTQVRHEGDKYRDVLNYAYTIRMNGFEFAVLGDAALNADNLGQISDGRPLNALFVNFPFLTVRAGRSVLKSTLQSDQLFVFHLPFEADDTENYRKSAIWCASKAQELGLPPTTLFLFPNTCIAL